MAKKDVIKGTTTQGFEYEIPMSNFDYEYMELIAEIDEKPYLMAKLIRTTLGDDLNEKLKDFCRKEDGTIPLEDVEAIFNEIILGNTKTKNS